MTIVPMGDNIIIEVEKEESVKQTASGIYLPTTNNQTKPDKGVVIATGQGRILSNGETIKPVAEIGDQVIFNRFAGTEVVANDKKYLIIKENDVLAIIIE